MDSSVYTTYFKLEDTHWWFLGRKKILAEMLLRTFPEKIASACDIGCGKGENLRLLEPVAKKLSGIEMSHDAASLARKNFPNADIETGIFPQTAAPKNVQLITMFDVLEHIDDDVGSLKSIYESLTPGGKFICAVPAFPLLWSTHDEMVHHKRRYTRKTLRKALEAAGFRLERMTYFNAIFFLPTLAFRFLKSMSQDKKSDLFPFPPLINSIFTALFGAERFALRFSNIPFGVSLLAIARKPQQ